MDSLSNPKPAILEYGHGQFVVISPGGYVVCAVTGQRIALDRLRYWSVELQEPYASPQEAHQRHGTPPETEDQ